MRTHHSTPDSVLPNSRALRDVPGSSLRTEDLGEVTVQSEALYLGARSGANGVDGVVVKVPSGAYRVITTIDEGAGRSEIVALSVVLSGTNEAMRQILPGGAFWHDAPGDLPLIDGAELIVSDAALHDRYRDPNWPWDGWLRDVVDPAIQDARSTGRSGVAIAYPGSPDALIQVAPIAGDVVVFAAFDNDGRPTSIHLETLAGEPASDASGDVPPPWISGVPAVTEPSADERPVEHSPFGASSPFSEAASVGPSPVGESAPVVDASPSPSGPFGVPSTEPSHTGQSSFAGPQASNTDAWSGPSDAPDENQQISAAALGSLHDSPDDQGHAEAFDMATPPPTAVFTTPFHDQQPAAATHQAPVADPGAERLATDAATGVEAADRRDAATAIPLLTQVTDALANGIGERATVQAALASASLTGAQLVDSLVDVLLQEQRADEAIHRLGVALNVPQLRGNDDEVVHLRHRLGELQLRSGAIAEATATLEIARAEANALSRRSATGGFDSGEIGNHYLAHITYDLATAQLQSGNAAPAAELALEAMRTFERLRVARMAGRSAFLAASAYTALGQEASKQQAFAAAERIFRQGNELDGLGTALGFLGEADALRGEYASAAVKFEQARGALEEAGELTNAAIAAENEAICFEHLGRLDEAAERREIATSLEQRATHA